MCSFLAGLEVDGVDDAVGVDVLPVYMGADQHLAAVDSIPPAAVRLRER